MGRRGGAKQKINKKIARLNWLLYTNSPPPAWTTAQKLQAELDYFKSILEAESPNTTTHSANMKVINAPLITPPPPKQLPRRPEACSSDCRGPLISEFCKYTCMKTGTSFS